MFMKYGQSESGKGKTLCQCNWSFVWITGKEKVLALMEDLQCFGVLIVRRMKLYTEMLLSILVSCGCDVFLV